MTGDRKVETIILGGGCAGLWLAYELSARGLSCVVIDGEHGPGDGFAGYASTRNQGWLQSGALYVALGQLDTALECMRGYEINREFAPEAVQDDFLSYLLFATEAEQLDVVERCTS